MQLLAHAHDLRDTLQARAREIEDARRLPADLAADMAAMGFFRMLVPVELGGLEVSPPDFVRVLEALAGGDAATAWCAMVSGTSALTLAYLPTESAQQICATPDLIMGGVFAPMGKAVMSKSNYRLSGRWQWASGSQNCHWLCAGAMVVENGELKRLPNGGPEQRMFVFPRENAELIDTWHVSGLKGTGSGDMAADDIVVPREHSLSLTADKPVAQGALYVFPVFGLLALGIAAVALGNAGAALDAVKELAVARKPAGGRRTLAQRGAAQSEFAKIRAQWAAARAFVLSAVQECWDVAQTTGELSIEQRAELRLACTHATRTSADVARGACEMGGGSAVFLDSQLQRRLRDAQVACAHMMVAPPTYELAGRIAFGLETDTTLL